MQTDYIPSNPASSSVSRKEAHQKPRRTKRGFRWLSALKYTFLLFFIAGIILASWLFFTSSGTKLRYMMADSLITTQHRHWAKYLLGEQGLEDRVLEYMVRFDEMAAQPVNRQIHIPVANTGKKERPLVEIEPIEGAGFKGYLLVVSDPKKLRIVVPNKVGKGEKVSSMVERTGAVAGVNAGGFVDPNWEGNGFQPAGIVVADGEIFYNGDSNDDPTHIVGIDKDGTMIVGKYRPSELLEMGVKEAVTFAPRFIVDGKGLIKNRADGWGIAPRTSMAQKEDGTVLFAIIDGRQTHSMGASLYDIQQIFLDRGAIIAANLDGGSSTVLVHNNEIINSPCSPYGERYLPTAWLVFNDPEQVDIKNIWEGLAKEDIDPSKW